MDEDENVTVRERSREEAATNTVETVQITAEVHPPPRGRRNSGIPRPIGNSPALRRVVNSPVPRAPPWRDNGDRNPGISANARLLVSEEVLTLHMQHRDGDLREFRQFAQTANVRFGLTKMQTSPGNRVRTIPGSPHREVMAPIDAGAHRDLPKTPVNSRGHLQAEDLSAYDSSDAEVLKYDMRRSASPNPLKKIEALGRCDVIETDKVKL